MKILFLILLSFSLHAQPKWYRIDKHDIGMMIGQAMAGTADGFNQSIQSEHITGNQFWNYHVSWKNKYKNFDQGDKRPAFFLSTSALVFLTDGYHLTRMLNRTCDLVSFGLGMEDLSRYEKKDRWKVILKKVILSAIANRVAFNIIYK